MHSQHPADLFEEMATTMIQAGLDELCSIGNSPDEARDGTCDASPVTEVRATSRYRTVLRSGLIGNIDCEKIRPLL